MNQKPRQAPPEPPQDRYGVSEARGQLRDILQSVRLRGARVVITHYDDPVAAFVPLSDLSSLDPLALTSGPRITSRELRDGLRAAITNAMKFGTRAVIAHYDDPIAALIPHDDLRQLAPPTRPRQHTRHEITPGGPMRTTRVITFFSHAGGVGKTSSCRDIGYELAQLGHKILLIDLDPQANLTDWLGVDPEAVDTVTLYEAIVDNQPLPEAREVHGMHIYPSGLELAKLEARLSGENLGGVDRLRKILRPVVDAGTYDFILIDTPPTLGKAVTIALFASHDVIVPVSSRNKGLAAVKTVHEMVHTYREWNPHLNILSHLVTQRGNTSHSRAAHEAAFEALPNPSGPIKARPAIYDECQLAKQPVGAFQPKGEAREEIRAAVSQILAYMAVPA